MVSPLLSILACDPHLDFNGGQVIQKQNTKDGSVDFEHTGASLSM